MKLARNIRSRLKTPKTWYLRQLKAVNYLKAENAYLDAVMIGTRKFQDDLFTEMEFTNRILIEEIQVFQGFI